MASVRLLLDDFVLLLAQSLAQTRERAIDTIINKYKWVTAKR